MSVIQSNLDCIEPFGNKKLEYIENVQQSYEVTVRIDENIREIQYYGYVIERINNLTENDKLNIVVNTNGGDLKSTLALVNAIQNTKAEVTCFLEGSAYSGGSVIALSCPNVVVSPYATLFIHSDDSVSFGKRHEHVSMFNFNNKWTTTILKDIYEGFLTDEEIKDMLDGKDFYFDAVGIVDRLNKREKYFKDVAE